MRKVTGVAAAGFALPVLLCAQTTINGGRTITGAWDASGASSTKPAKSGTALPPACAVGEQFFKTDAGAGQNLYFCTAANSWTQMAGVGGSPNAADKTAANVFTRGQTITGSQDEVQLEVTGNGAQSAPILRVRKSDGTGVLQVNNDGSVEMGAAAGPWTLTSQAAPGGAPAAGYLYWWADSAEQAIKARDAAGNTSVMVRSSGAVANQFVTGIGSNGQVSRAQPAFSDLTGTAAAAQLPTPAPSSRGGVESGACTGTDKVTGVGSDGRIVCGADQTGGAASVPDPTGQTGKVLASDGTATPLWQDPNKGFVGVLAAGFSGGELADGKLRRTQVKYGCTLADWTVLGDAPGTISFEVRRASYADFPATASLIGAAAKPGLSAAQKNTSASLAGWTATVLNAGDVVEIAIAGAPSGLAEVTLAMKCTR